MIFFMRQNKKRWSLYLIVIIVVSLVLVSAKSTSFRDNREKVRITQINDSTVKYYLPHVEGKTVRYPWFCYYIITTNDGIVFKEGVEGKDYQLHEFMSDYWPKIQVHLPKTFDGVVYYGPWTNRRNRMFILGKGDEIIISSPHQHHPSFEVQDTIRTIKVTEIRVGDQEDKDYYNYLHNDRLLRSFPTGYRLLVLDGDYADIYIKAKRSDNAIKYLDKIMSGCDASKHAISQWLSLKESGDIPLMKEKDEFYFTKTEINNKIIAIDERIQDRVTDSLKYLLGYPQRVKIRFYIPSNYTAADYDLGDRRFSYHGRDEILVRTQYYPDDKFYYCSSTQPIKVMCVKRTEEVTLERNPYDYRRIWYPYYNYWDKEFSICGEKTDEGLIEYVRIRSRSKQKALKMLKVILSGCDLSEINSTPDDIIKSLE